VKVVRHAEQVEAQRLGVLRLLDQAVGGERLEAVNDPEPDPLARDGAHTRSVPAL
jgi:uncharacterized protein (DUF2249 family)